MKEIVKDIEKANELAFIFKALSHPIRVQIVAGLIKVDECNVSNMVKCLKASQPAISQHINVLKTLGVIKGYRKGNQICYKVDNETVRKIYNIL
ncbi:MAG: transcriptional regulator, ArsR family protein [uncultured bacterium]|nr:MAG: transcriptional regulator, ArsR family protein [uncultured bacterium]